MWPEIDSEECKGCRKCVAACPKQVLHMSEDFNSRGYRYAVYSAEGCSGCGICYYNCPEPFAIRVHTEKKTKSTDNS